jgi:hypothetical protein
MLGADVEWNDFAADRRVRTICGREAVAERLRECSGTSCPIDLRGLVVQRGSIAAEFTIPWWRERPRLRAAIAAAVGGTFTQSLTFGDTIERIDNRESLFARVAVEPHLQHDLLLFLLDR